MSFKTYRIRISIINWLIWMPIIYMSYYAIMDNDIKIIIGFMMVLLGRLTQINVHLEYKNNMEFYKEK